MMSTTRLPSRSAFPFRKEPLRWKHAEGAKRGRALGCAANQLSLVADGLHKLHYRGAIVIPAPRPETKPACNAPSSGQGSDERVCFDGKR